jgi:hypothetical protein
MYSIAEWLILFLCLANVGLAGWMISKILKLEKFQTGEAQANLELINQSLNRLSNITETLERQNQPVRMVETANSQNEENPEINKERRAIYLLRKGENPRLISRKLGLSRSEMDLLVASEKLGNGQKTNLTAI